MMHKQMMNAKKKALMELMKKMRGMEASSMGDMEGPKEEEMEEEISPGIHDKMHEDEDDEDNKVNVMDGQNQSFDEENEDNPMSEAEEFMKEKKDFMGRSNKLPHGKNSKSIMISLAMKAKPKMMMKGK